MNTQHFRYALEVEKTGSITQAAENLFMGQPNLSKAIKELEDTLGIVIFKRTPRGVVPTEKGRTFLRYAKSILTQIDEMQSLNDENRSERKTFRLCVPRASYCSLAAMRFMASLDDSEALSVRFAETNSIDGVNMVADGTFSMGIIRYQTTYETYFRDYFHDKGLAYETVWEYEKLIIMSRENPLAAKEGKLTLSDFVGNIEISHGDCRVPYIQVPQSEDLIPTQKTVELYEGTNPFLMLSYMKHAYLWGSPMPKEYLDRYGLVQRRCEATTHRYKDVMLYRAGTHPGEWEQRYLDKLYEMKNSLAFAECR